MIKDIEVKDSAIGGKGVFARRDFSKGDFLFRTTPGKRIPFAEAMKRTEAEREHIDDPDAEGMCEMTTSPTKYVNHSCDPNAVWKGRFAFAHKDIKAGEEITTDYRIYCISGWKMKCNCGHCDGEIEADFFTLPIDKQNEYWHLIPRRVRAKTPK